MRILLALDDSKYSVGATDALIAQAKTKGATTWSRRTVASFVLNWAINESIAPVEHLESSSASRILIIPPSVLNAQYGSQARLRKRISPPLSMARTSAKEVV